MAFRRLLVIVPLALVLWSGSVAANAQTTVAPPGNSGVDEYVETVPSANGPSHQSPSKPSESSLPSSTQQALRSKGSDGAAVVQLASTNGEASQAGVKSHGDKGKNKGGADHVLPTDPAVGSAASGSSDSLPVAVIKSVTKSGSGGMGLLLPLILGFALIAGASSFLIRRRSR